MTGGRSGDQEDSVEGLRLVRIPRLTIGEMDFSVLLIYKAV
jgi:ribosomal protein L30/L7E